MSRARSSRATPPPSRRRRFALATALAATLALGADESAARSPGGAALTLRPGLPQVSLTLPEALPAPSEAEQQYFPFLEGEPIDHTISVGDTSNGFLVNGRAVQESAALGILPIQRERDLRYGSEELVALLEKSAASYYAATKSRMWIGNVGKRRGGDIPWSVSHNSGRDADIAFAYLDLSGKPVDPPDLVPLNQDGLNATYRLRFDAARTWQIVRGLLGGDAEVQYLFIASGLRDQLLVHAQKAGEPAALIQKAAIVMRQPVGAAPHSDHLHLRIYCSRRDVLGGCVNTGAVHDFAELHEDAKEAAVARIAKVMGAGDTEQQKRAIERLVLLGAREQADAIAAHLRDEPAVLREAAARALGSIGRREQVALLETSFDREVDVATRIAMAQASGQLGGKEAGRFLARVIGVPRRGVSQLLDGIGAASTLRSPALLSLLPEATALSREALFGEDLPSRLGRWALGGGALGGRHEHDGERAVQLAGVAAAALGERLEPVPALIGLLEDRDGEVRATAAHALRLITNVTYRIDWAEGDDAERARGLARWQAAWSRSKRAARPAWLVMGFRAEGYEVPSIDRRHLWELVRATTGGDHLSYNAQRLLERITKHQPPSLEWSKNDACQHWLSWLKKRREGFDLDAPPKKVTRACYSPAF